MRAKSLKFQIKIIMSEPFQLKLGGLLICWFSLLLFCFVVFFKGFPHSYTLVIQKYIRFFNMLVFSFYYNNFYPTMLQGTI